MRYSIPLKGFLTGMLLQLAIGPVFILIMNQSVSYGLYNGWASVAGVVVVDYFYIILAVFGVGKILDHPKAKKIFSLVGSLVLIGFGSFMIISGILPDDDRIIEGRGATLRQSFLSTFLLTISSPLTILFWTGIFTNKSIEYSLSSGELVVFGLMAGVATPVFLGTAATCFSLFNLFVPNILIKILNIFVGIILIGFALWPFFSNKIKEQE